ncbi:hypothetical protein Trydic_g15749 [Trypoxylus dichotomus]
MDSAKKILTRKNESGDERNLQNQTSNESLISVIFPWRGENSLCKRRPHLVSYYESGRIISPTDFYLCMMAILLLCTSVGLTVISTWLIIHRLPFLHLTDGSFFMEANTFTLFASLISIPCCWITWICHYNKKNYAFLPLLIVILGFSISMLSIGLSIGLVQKSKMTFDRTIHPPKLLPTRFKAEMNATLSSTMSLYHFNSNYRYGWDKIQQRLRCCGIERPDDWLYYGHVPKSCYIDYKCSNPKLLHLKGCLNIISYELAWEICLLSGLSFITFTVQVISLLLAIVIYVKDKLGKNNGGNATT